MKKRIAWITQKSCRSGFKLQLFCGIIDQTLDECTYLRMNGERLSIYIYSRMQNTQNSILSSPKSRYFIASEQKTVIFILLFGAPAMDENEKQV